MASGTMQWAVLALSLSGAACSAVRVVSPMGHSFNVPPGLLDGAGPPCNQSDTTIQCCLKQNPGQYERCGALPPDPKPEPVRRPVPPVNVPVEQPDEDPPHETKERCSHAYAKCIDLGGGKLPGRVAGQSRCSSCLDYCLANGFWPLAIYSWTGQRMSCPN